MGCQALGACQKNRDGNWSPMFNLCRQVPLSIALIGDPAPIHRGVRSSNHDRGCDRRDAWVGLSPDLKTITSEPTVGKATPSMRAKWRSSPSACHGVLEKGLTPPTLSETRFFANISGERVECTRTCRGS